jgi:hypothetical protein
MPVDAFALRDATNQFEHPGEIGGFGVLLAGFVAGQLL